MSEVYLGNPNLKKANTAIEFTQEQILEFMKCKEDPVYFANKYVKIISLDEGLTQFHPYHFQEKLINNFHNNRFNICKMPRQTGKSTTVVSYLLHYAVFNDSVNIGILANKAATARELLGRLQTAYENLPKWMQQGIIAWNKGSLELENGSKILAASTSASAVRGMSFNILFLDEFAFVPNHVADSFFASVYPTITSGKNTKVIIVSTPHGMNHFYRMWHDSEKGKNEYIPTDVHWSEVPGRDEVWKEQTIANTSEQQFKVEFECEFLGSVNTLINPSILKNLIYEDPIQRNAGLDVYEKKKEEHNYLITVDVARGLGNDYSAFIVVDITEFPYKIVAKYKNNEIKPMLFPNIIQQTAKAYNDAWVLVEVNDIGEETEENNFPIPEFQVPLSPFKQTYSLPLTSTVYDNIRHRGDSTLFMIMADKKYESYEEKKLIKINWNRLGPTHLRPKLTIYDHNRKRVKGYLLKRKKHFSFQYLLPEGNEAFYLKISDEIGFLEGVAGSYQSFRYFLTVY